jgi:hypothetical protein
MPTPCRYVVGTGQWQEYECGLTGASISRDCRTFGDCMPRWAWAILWGQRPLGDLGRRGRDARENLIRQIARRKSVEIGEITEESLARARAELQSTGYRSDQMAEEQAVRDLTTMTTDELEELLEKVREQKKARLKVQKQRPALKRRLDLQRAKRDDLNKTIQWLEDAIAKIDRGETADMPMLRRKKGGGPISPAGTQRVISPESRERMGRKGPHQTEEQRNQARRDYMRRYYAKKKAAA